MLTNIRKVTLFLPDSSYKLQPLLSYCTSSLVFDSPDDTEEASDVTSEAIQVAFEVGDAVWEAGDGTWDGSDVAIEMHDDALAFCWSAVINRAKFILLDICGLQLILPIMWCPSYLEFSFNVDETNSAVVAFGICKALSCACVWSWGGFSFEHDERPSRWQTSWSVEDALVRSIWITNEWSAYLRLGWLLFIFLFSHSDHCSFTLITFF